ncbi:IS4 family transposase [Candidatus Tisiphia endosymbiont of Nemotelus uliginosus]|uniref:IS4 family transposase n=1 Tax=Candidatus Tisiphia endosymbiont of Nemotelus uliginosus TaxID=3077926 RepID=UPI0035C8C24A
MDSQSLYQILYIFLDWHPARIKTFAELICAVVKAKTVRIKELALYVASKGNLHAKIVKVERLLLEQNMCFISLGKIIVKLLCLTGKISLAIDRTSWQFGIKNLNFFVATIVYGNISIPIAWLLLDKKGNSSTNERKKLIEQILTIIPKEMIELILADREFVGEEWLQYMGGIQKLPFAIRLRKSEKVKHFNGGKMKLNKCFADMQMGDTKTIESKIYNGMAIKITCLQLEREQLFIASNVLIGECALLAYKQRWSIERPFLSLKSSGFNIEDTHITDQKKLEKLFAIVSLSLAICVLAGDIKNKIYPIKIKKHGRKLYSLFTYGFDWIKDYFYNSLSDTPAMLFSLLRKHIMHAFQLQQ